MKLIKRDVLDVNVPEELVGSFDIVHIRAFGSLIKNSDCSPVLKAVDRLLKPGGWLQWEESDTSAMIATSGGEGADGSGSRSCTALLGVLRAGGQATGTTFE